MRMGSPALYRRWASGWKWAKK